MSDWESDSEETTAPIPNPEYNRATGYNYVGGGQHRHVASSGSRGASRKQGNKIISIPSNKVGLVIGRGGVRIRELEYGSDAKISIGDSSEFNTNVTLYGTDTSIDTVERMIKDLIIDRPRKNTSQVEEDIYSNAAAGPSVVQSSWSPWSLAHSLGNEYIDYTKIYEDSAREQLRWAEIPVIVKNFYKEDAHVAAMKPEDVVRWRLVNNNIQVNRTGGTIPIPNPVMTFEQAFKGYPEIHHEIYNQGLKEPSPMQSQAWPIILKGENIVAIAPIGSGKTLVFLLPALIHIYGQPTPKAKRPGPTVLILVPTTERVLQIASELKKYNSKRIKSVCLYDGVDRQAQIEILANGVDMVIATPGRLCNLINSNHIRAVHFSYIVLDKADRMLNMGFEPQIRMTLSYVCPEYQCVMISATWVPAIQQLAQTFMKNPIYLNVGSLDLAAVHTVTQVVRVVEEMEKDALLFDFIQNRDPNDRIVVFCGRKDRASDIAATLLCLGIPCRCLHGDGDQAALEDMTNRVVNILVVTDAASRRIDIKDSTYVINLDFPKNIEEYVHRIGRRGQPAKTGVSLSFMTNNDVQSAKPLINILRQANQEIPYELQILADSFRPETSKKRGRHGRNRGRGGTNWW